MNSILEAVAQERQAITERLAALDEIEQLGRTLDPGAAEPEPQLAADGDFDREQIAEATGDLLEAGRVSLNPDGTYSLTGSSVVVT